MFKEIYGICNSGLELTMAFSSPVHGKLSVSVLPKKKEGAKVVDLNIPPLVISGTPEDFENDFLEYLTGSMQPVSGLISNQASFKANVVAEKEKTVKTVKTRTAENNNENKSAEEKKPQQKSLF